MIILASASPRRRELLSQIISTFSVIPAVGEERADKHLPPKEYVAALAGQKCDEVFASHPNAVVIGCDTVVVYNGKILGKPKDENDAIQTLTCLSGNEHEVLTGVCVQAKGKRLVKVDQTKVIFNKLDKGFISDYVASGSPMDKAGSYGIQDGGLVKEICGSYTNVVGLPIELLKSMLGEFLSDIKVEENE